MREIFSPQAIRKVGIWGIFACCLDISLFHIAARLGASPELANFAGFKLAGIILFVLLLIEVRKLAIKSPGFSWVRVTVNFILTGVMIFFLRGGILALFAKVWGLPIGAAVIPAAVVGDLVLAGIAVQYLAAPAGEETGKYRKWAIFTIGMILYLLVLRLVYLGALELMPEETYYWNYSQHLDWGYLDHPPMVAWIIAIGAKIFGITEFGVRVGSIICWMVTAAFAYATTRRIYGREAGVSSILIISVIPFFFGVGSLMLPDAPLVACWAGGLYFLSLILAEKNAKAWYGFGLCIGLGMISKYTIGGLALSVILFLIINRESRWWLKRIEPYLSGVIAAVIFLPVIIWNAENGWASFVFQTSRRLEEVSQFSLHLLIGSIIVLLTPHGIMAAIRVLKAPNRIGTAAGREGGFGSREKLLYTVVLLPLAIFIVFSIDHQPKLNWTGPLWLAIVPAYAVMVTFKMQSVRNSLERWVYRSWNGTVVTLAIIYGFGLYYLAFGVPGLPYSTDMSDLAGWRDLADKVRIVDAGITQETGQKPLIVGMDKYNISSELAFYNYPDGPVRTAGRHLFGDISLMYKSWFPDSLQSGKTILMVGRDSTYLFSAPIVRHFERMGEFGSMTANLNNQEISRFFYRVGYGYSANR